MVKGGIISPALLTRRQHLREMKNKIPSPKIASFHHFLSSTNNNMYLLLALLLHHIVTLSHATSDVGSDFMIGENEDNYRRNTFLDVVVGVHFGMPRQQCATICRQLGDEACTGFTTSQITRVCILFRRANTEQEVAQQEFYVKIKKQINSQQQAKPYEVINHNNFNKVIDKVADQLIPTFQHRTSTKRGNNRIEKMYHNVKLPQPPKRKRLPDDEDDYYPPPPPPTTTTTSTSTTTTTTTTTTPPPPPPPEPEPTLVVPAKKVKLTPGPVVPGYTVFPVNCLGSTLSGHKNLGTVHDCARLCDLMNDCEGFSYSSMASDCFLKASRECTHPTGENSAFKFFRKESKVQTVSPDTIKLKSEDEDVVSMVDGLVEEDDYAEATTEAPITMTPFFYVPTRPVPPKVRQPTPRRISPTPVSTNNPPTVATSPSTTTIEEPTTVVVDENVDDDKPTKSYLYTPLAGNCPDNNIGELLPLQYPHCAKLCDNHPGCKGFAYSAIGPSCVLKSSQCFSPVASQYTFYAKQ